MWNALTQTMRDAERYAAREIVGRVLLILENGDQLGHGWMSNLSDEQRERLRQLRRQVCERDLYELLYGALPPDAVDPQTLTEPDFDAALSVPVEP